MEKELNSIWPTIQDIQQGKAEKSPIWKAVTHASQIASVTEGINLPSTQVIGKALSDNESLKWILIVGLLPAAETTPESLEALWSIYRRFQDRLEVKFILPDQLHNHRPRHNLSLVELRDNKWAAWIGSSPSFGIGSVPVEPYLNLWFSVEGTLLSQLNNYIKTFAAIGVEFTEAILKLPRLVPAEGTLEAKMLWDEYESSLLGDFEENPVSTIDSIHVDDEKGVQITDSQGKLKDIALQTVELPRHDAIAEKIYSLINSCKQIIPGKAVSPPAAPLKAEWFGLKSFSEGRLKTKFSASINVFDSEEQKGIEKCRRITSDMIEKLGYSVADGIRLVPMQSIETIKREIQSKESKIFEIMKDTGLEHSNKDDSIEAFIEKRKGIILNECKEKYKIINPGKNIPDDLYENVINALKSRVENFLSNKIAADFTCTPFSLDLNQPDQNSQAWSMAFRLLEEIFKKPRMFFKDQYGFRLIGDTSIKKQEYLNHLNFGEIDCFFKDKEVLNVEEKSRFPSPGISQRAILELKEVKEIKEKQLSSREKCEKIIAIMQRETNGSWPHPK
jgi:hypothetical protein